MRRPAQAFAGQLGAAAERYLVLAL